MFMKIRLHPPHWALSLERFGTAVDSGATPQEAIMQVKDLLVKSDVAYIKPERVQTFEIGYSA